jgi:hypothetical protein
MTTTEKLASLDALLIAQVTGLIRVAAEQAAHNDPFHAVQYKAHLHKLIAADCSAKARMFDEAVEEFRKKHSCRTRRTSSRPASSNI